MLRHRVLIVGVGSIGERHLRCFSATDRAELSLCEINDGLRRTIAQRYDINSTYRDLNEALADTDNRCSVGVIATPAHLHVQIATTLVEAGVHALIEKPLSTNLDGVAALIESANRKNVTVAVAYMLRCHPVLQSMRQAILDGRFGQPIAVLVASGQHFPTYRPAYREIYYNNHATGGGAIQDALTHLVNACEWIVGPADRVIADASHQVLEGVDVEDTVHMVARHGDVSASYNINQYQAPNETTITVICTGGTVRFEAHNARWVSMIKPGDPWHEEMTWTGERDPIYTNQANAFMDSVEGRSPVLCTVQEGRQTLQVILSVLAAADDPDWRRVAENI